MERKPPLVTVVVPTYNHEIYVLDCISSILGQDYPNIELIVINDGSTDSTEARVKDYIEKNNCRFTFISKQNEGPGKTVSLGFKLAKGKYFTYLGSDDKLVQGSIRKMVEYLEANPDMDAVFGFLIFMDSSGKPEETLPRRKKEMFTSLKHSFEDFVSGRTMLTLPTGLTKSSTIKALGGFDKDFYTEDVYMRYLLTLNANIAYMEEPIIFYRQHSTNISKGKPFWMRREKILTFEKLLPLVKTERLKRLVTECLFKEYLRYVKQAFIKGADRTELSSAIEKALKIKSFSITAIYYKLRLKLDARA